MKPQGHEWRMGLSHIQEMRKQISGSFHIGSRGAQQRSKAQIPLVGCRYRQIWFTGYAKGLVPVWTFPSLSYTHTHTDTHSYFFYLLFCICGGMGISRRAFSSLERREWLDGEDRRRRRACSILSGVFMRGSPDGFAELVISVPDGDGLGYGTRVAGVHRRRCVEE